MNTRWTAGDSLDFDSLLRSDLNLDPDELHQRDRTWFREQHSPDSEPETELSRSETTSLLQSWLAFRRSAQQGELLPGQTLQTALHWLQTLLPIAGLCSGLAAGWAFFSYAGDTPVNVLYFLVLFILPQTVILILLALYALAGGWRTTPGQRWPLFLQLTKTLLQRLAQAIAKRIPGSLSAEDRLCLAAASGDLQAFFNTQGAALFWLLSGLLQLTALAINAGLLIASTVKITVTDLAFGWQSTLQFSSHSLARLVEWLALPWSWWLPAGRGYPHLAQIEGSRIVLKEGISQLNTADLVSWWPFLLLCLLVYALLPRLLLYLYSRHRQQRALRQAILNRPAVSQLLARMHTPLLNSQGDTDSANTGAVETGPFSPPSAAVGVAMPLLLLAPEEISSSLPQARLQTLFASEGYQVSGLLPVPSAHDQQDSFFQGLPDQLPAGSAVCLLAEAWMPPIHSTLLFLQRLRQSLGQQTLLMVRLLGKSTADQQLTPPHNPVMVAVWRQKLAALADPALQVLPLLSEKSHE